MSGAYSGEGRCKKCIAHGGGAPNVPLAVKTATLSQASETAPYSKTLAATGGTAPYSWSITAGSLPPGLTLAAGGQITGTATASGAFAFTATVTDATTPTETASANLSITVKAPR